MKTIKFFACLIVLSFSFNACDNQKNVTNDNKDQSSANKALRNLFDRYYEGRLKFFPFESTDAGEDRYNDLFPNSNTQAFRNDLKAFYTVYLDSLNQFKKEGIDANNLLALEVLKYDVQMNIKGFDFPDYLMPLNQFWGMHLSVGQYGSGTAAQPFKTVKDYDNWLKRIDGYVVWSDSAIANMQAGISRNMVLPTKLVTKIIPQYESTIASEADKSLFYDPIKNFPKSFSESDKARLSASYAKMIYEKINPAHSKMLKFLKEDYLKASRSSSGISALKGGTEHYAYLAASWTTTDLSPDQIHATGLQEVARIRAEMEKTMQSVGFKGNLSQFFEFMKTDKQFMPFKVAKEVTDSFASILVKIEPNLSKMFSSRPKCAFEVRQTEAFRAASASAEYNSGSVDGTRPGIFYVPVLDAKTYNTTSGFESLFLHEAIPGHHFQSMLQRENEALPKFLRFNWYGAYGEGWALYCESLGKELGLYSDPYQYMGALGDEMHRAVRLVVDVAIHTKGMSREAAIQYMMENEAISEEGAIAEIERYMAIPGQAVSYKIGALKIRALRTKYEKELGAKFSLADFHARLLESGCLPLNVLENKMNTWAATIK
jgi:uncharacterized protein (DUF885 family)